MTITPNNSCPSKTTQVGTSHVTHLAGFGRHPDRSPRVARPLTALVSAQVLLRMRRPACPWHTARQARGTTRELPMEPRSEL